MKKYLMIVIAFCSLNSASFAQNADIFKGKALNFEIRKNFEEAAKNFEEAAKAYKMHNIVDTLSIYKAGVNYVKVKKFQKAIPFLEKTLALNYNVNNTSLLLADAYAEIKKPELAEKILKEAKVKIPGKAMEFDKKLAYLYFNSGQYEKSLNAFAKLNSLFPDNENYMYLYGYSLERVKKYKKAMAVFKKMQQSFPNGKKAKRMMAITYVENTIDDNYNEINHYNSLSNKNLENYVDTQKRLKAMDSRYEKARIMLEGSLRDYPNDPLIIRMLYKVYKKQNNTVKMNQMKKLLK